MELASSVGNKKLRGGIVNRVITTIPLRPLRIPLREEYPRKKIDRDSIIIIMRKSTRCFEGFV